MILHLVGFWYRRSLIRPRNLIRVISDGYANHLLATNCCDWTIYNRDWPRYGMTKTGLAHYEVIACTFWTAGRGLGRTQLEATRRAIRNMRVRDSKLPRISFKGMVEVINVALGKESDHEQV